MNLAGFLRSGHIFKISVECVYMCKLYISSTQLYYFFLLFAQKLERANPCNKLFNWSGLTYLEQVNINRSVIESHRYLINFGRLKQLYCLGELTRGVATTFIRTRELRHLPSIFTVL